MRSSGGGAATAGGVEFQAAVTAIVGIHMLRGTPLGWLGGDADDVPTAVWAETQGPGDDIRLDVERIGVVEIQVKKGLTRKKDLWESLLAMAKAVAEKTIAFGVLVVAPDSSRSIKTLLSQDIRRMGLGRQDDLSDIGRDFVEQLVAEGLDAVAACRSLRIRVVHALEADAADVQAAQEVLRFVCADGRDAGKAWNALFKDAVASMRRRGRWEVHQLARLLRAEGIALRDADFPGAVADRLCRWVACTTRTFALAGLQRELPLTALMPVKAVVSAPSCGKSGAAAEALASYRSAAERVASTREKIFDAEWLGRLYRLVVVVAGPGLGKTTLLTKLAHCYAVDGFPVLKVSLKRVSAAMMGGQTFEDSVLRHGSDGSHISTEALARARLRQVVLLADGLDDCGSQHDEVARCLHAFAAGRPGARVIVTTRPIGYGTVRLLAWRHYELLAPNPAQAPWHLASLIGAAAPGQFAGTDFVAFLKGELEVSAAGGAIARSPQMLGMAAALIVRGSRLPASKAALYGQFFELFGQLPNTRAAGERPESDAILGSALGNLGWELTKDPLATRAGVVRSCAAQLAPALGISPLAALVKAEACINHWEDVGIVERLHVDEGVITTFVHKSFAEFAAARHLADLSDDARTAALNEILDLPQWHEPVAFAIGNGLGGPIAECLLARHLAGEPTGLERAAAVAGDLGANVPDGVTRAIVKAAVAEVEAATEGAGAAGVMLAALARTRTILVAEATKPLFSSGDLQERLVAWACATQGDPDSLELPALEKALGEFLTDLDLNWSAAALFKRVSRSGEPRDLAQLLGLAVLKKLPEGRLVPYAESLLGHRALSTFDYCIKVSATVNARGVDWTPLPLRDPVEPAWHKSLMSTAAMLMPPPKWHEAFRTALLAVANAISQNRGCDPAASQIGNAPQLRALLDLIGFYEAPISDFYCWDKPYDYRAFREMLRVFVAITKLDTAALAADAAATIERLDAKPVFDAFTLEWPLLDVAAPDWTAVPQAKPDLALLERGLSHGSSWCSWLAGELLRSAVGSRDVRAGSCQP